MRRPIYNFAIDPDLRAALIEVKLRDGISESEQIRRALREWLTKRGVIKSPSRRAPTRRKG